MKRKNVLPQPGSRPVAIVTGAASGIGKSVAAELAKQGYDVAAIDIAWKSTPKARESALQVTDLGTKILRLDADIADLGGHEKILQTILRSFGTVDLLVNNAGVAPLERRDILDLTPDSYDRLLNINLRGPFFFTRQIARWMLEAKPRQPERRFTIIFITSISAIASSTNRAEYCISKSGLSMAATLYADRLAAEGIAVFEIRPGVILTPMTEPVRQKYDRLIAEGLTPQMRWGQPQDVANAVAALAGGAFAFSTGAVIEVSGGMNVRRL
jgi:3-oxoacyl-[acyl-carrier protein] reductase